MSLLAQLTPFNAVLVTGIISLFGIFVWLIKKFVASYAANTEVMAKVNVMLTSVDHKLDQAAGRDIEMIKTLERISTRQESQRLSVVKN